MGGHFGTAVQPAPLLVCLASADTRRPHSLYPADEPRPPEPVHPREGPECPFVCGLGSFADSGPFHAVERGDRRPDFFEKFPWIPRLQSALSREGGNTDRHRHLPSAEIG